MPVLTFRVNVPLSTPANNPLTLNLVSQASAIQSITIWSPSANASLEKCGYRLTNRLGTTLIPDMGSKDNFAFSSGEDGWAPIPPQAAAMPMNDQVLEGPPYILQFKFYNIDAAAILIGGIITVREPMAILEHNAMLYEFLTSRPPAITDVSPETKTELESGKKSKVDMSKASIDISKLFKKDEKPVEHIKGK